MLQFSLCRETVTGMPRIEIEFEFDMIFCFGIVWHRMFFPLEFTFNTLHDLLKVIVLKHGVCDIVRPTVRSQFMNVGSYLYNRLGTIPERFISLRCRWNEKNDNS